MNIVKSVALSLLMLSSFACAKVSVEAVLADNSESAIAHGKILTMIPAITLDSNESKIEFVSDVRLQATLTESNMIQLDIAFQDEAGDYVPFAQLELVATATEAPSEITLAHKDGSQLVLLVQVTEIQ